LDFYCEAAYKKFASMKKDKKPYRILVIEDNPGDFVLVEDFLTEQIAFPVITHANNFEESVVLLTSPGTVFDIILLDLTLPDKDGENLVTAILSIANRCPVVILTGYTDIDFSIKSISSGIIDYILKDDLNAGMLYKSMVYAIERHRTILDLKESEKRYSDLFRLSPQPMCIYEADTYRITDANKAGMAHYGYSHEEFLNMTLFDLVPEEDRQKAKTFIINQDRQLNETYTGKFRNIKKSGEIIEVETFSTPLVINDKIATLIIGVDVTEKNLYEHRITKAIIKTQEDERYEIGGELHDNVCQILAGSLITLGILKRSVPEPSLPLLNQCKDYISMAAAEIRNLSHRLAPAFLNDSNLEEAFRLLLKTFNAENTHSINFNYDLSMKKNTISLDLQLNLYRILQEQLKNIFKYARAKQIDLDILIYNKKLKMSIADNGIGFDLSSVKRGIGLANMKRRAELFSGNIEIDASPGNGCRITVDIPLEGSKIDNV
jgi:PAS domain S-box-containing protein